MRRLVLGIALLAWAVLAFAAGRWSAPRAATAPSELYEGPVFDAMAQIDETVDMPGAMRWVREAGVSRIALFARSRKQLGENEQALLDLRAANPDLVVLGTPKFFLLRDDLDAAYVEATLQGLRAGRYAFVGEIMFTHGDKWDGTHTQRGERYVDPDAPGVAAFVRALAPLHAPLLTHWEMYDWERDWPRFSRLFAAHPEQVFVVPHLGFGTPAQVAEVLERHPNVYMTFSKKKWKTDKHADTDKTGSLGGGLLDERDRLVPAWRDLLVRYRGRLMWASDPNREYLWESYGDILHQYRRLGGQLPPDAAAELFCHTAERLYRVTAR